MIGLAAYSAVFSRAVPGLEDLAGIDVCGPQERAKNRSAIAVYAEQAVARMAPDPMGLGLVCLSGPCGPMVDAFDKAWQRSPDGSLTGPGFGAHRAKRIHPFTLLRSLQNQVPAILSMNLGITGPCINALDSATGLACLLPNIAAQLTRCRAILLVMAAAGEGLEEGSKRKARVPGASGLEGAICLLLTRDAALGTLELAQPDRDCRPAVEDLAAPVLAPGVTLLRHLALGSQEALITNTDESGFQSAVFWRQH